MYNMYRYFYKFYILLSVKQNAMIVRPKNSQWSKYLNEFESKFAEYVGTSNAICTSNGTTALHLVLDSLGIGPGDEVIVPDLTFIATANAISYTGAKPIFLDVDKDTMGLSPEKLEEFLKYKTSSKKDGFCYNNFSGKRLLIPMA